MPAVACMSQLAEPSVHANTVTAAPPATQFNQLHRQWCE